MPDPKRGMSDSPEALVVGLARTGDRDAFAELVRRRQSWIRNLMRRLSGDATLADDLAQQAILQAWRDIGRLKDPRRFSGWLKQLAINVWRQHARRHDVLENADPVADEPANGNASIGLGMDLDRALSSLAGEVRICVVLSYHEGMSHAEIARLTELPLGTVKSHIRRGAERLKTQLAAYAGETVKEPTDD